MLQVKFFTADIKTRFSTHGLAAQDSQDRYHRTLTTLYPDKLRIIKGYYSVQPRPLIRYKNPPDKADRVKVWTLEEKQTDVNIALHLYRDVVVKHLCDQVVVVTNDTDVEPALQMLRADCGNSVQVGVVLPLRQPVTDTTARPGNNRLSTLADWTRRYILEQE